MRTLIEQATLINESREYCASVLLEDGVIRDIFTEGVPNVACEETIDARGMWLMPGVIDDHVHMRDPGLTHKADMESETRAAAAGGVTSVMDMPNVQPQTTTLARWEEKMQHAAETARVNYAFYLGATNDNLDEVKGMDVTRVPALKMFMGSSTGGMLVDKEQQLRSIFRECPTLIMTHCEDTARICQRMAEAKAQQGEDPGIEWHPWIRDDEACYRSSALAVKMARETGARLHLAHVTTAKELELLEPSDTPLERKHITAEVCPQHLFYCDKDYARLGSLIKCNPSIKGEADRDALRKALQEGRFDIIATDHAPHLLKEKQGGAIKAVSGMPLMQFSLPLMLTLSSQGLLSRPQLVELMCHNPARLFRIDGRGFLRPGYKADLVLLRREEWTITPEDILSKCGWSPLTGETLSWKVAGTWVNGRKVFDGTTICDDVRGEALRFNLC